MVKGYFVYFENGMFLLEYMYVKEVLEMNVFCLYWISVCDRIMF